MSNPSSLVPAPPAVTPPPGAYIGPAERGTTVTTSATLGGITASTPTNAIAYALAASLGIPVNEVQISVSGTVSGRHLLGVRSKPASHVTFKLNVQNASHASWQRCHKPQRIDCLKKNTKSVCVIDIRRLETIEATVGRRIVGFVCSFHKLCDRALCLVSA